MKLKILLILIFIFFIACNTSNKKAKEHYLIAEKYFKIDDYANASIEIDKAISLYSENYDFYILSSDINRLLDNEDKAIDLLQKPLKANFKTDTINYKLGKCYFSKASNLSSKGANGSEESENLNKAISYYTLSLNENIRFYDAYIEKYKALHNLGEYEDAIVVINKAYTVFPDSLNLILFRGVAKGALGDTSEELRDLTEVIDSKSLDSINTALAYRWRGLANIKKGNHKLAIMDLTNSIKFNGKNSLTYENRADLYLKMKLTDSACADYRKAVDLGLVRLYDAISKNCK